MLRSPTQRLSEGGKKGFRCSDRGDHKEVARRWLMFKTSSETTSVSNSLSSLDARPIGVLRGSLNSMTAFLLLHCVSDECDLEGQDYHNEESKVDSLNAPTTSTQNSN